MEPVMLFNKLANMISYFEAAILSEDDESLRNCEHAMAMINRKDIEALQTVANVLLIIEKNPKIKKLVMDKYVDL